MLSDREQQALHEIERRLLIEDPGFARAFDAEAERIRPRPADVAWWVYTIVLGLSSTFAVVALMVGLPASALALLIVAALAWAARRRGHEAGRQPRDRS